MTRSCAGTLLAPGCLRQRYAGNRGQACGRCHLPGGNIVTVNDAQPGAEALAVGTRAEVDVGKGPSTQMIDLAGGTLVPGFVDGHSTWTPPR